MARLLTALALVASAGAFAPDAKKKYLAELKLQMDSQKANRRMEHLQHFGWDVGSKPDPRRELFAQFDQDGSGTIEGSEIRSFLRRVGLGDDPDELERTVRALVDQLVCSRSKTDPRDSC